LPNLLLTNGNGDKSGWTPMKTTLSIRNSLNTAMLRTVYPLPQRFSGLFAKVEMANTWSSPPNWVCIWVWDCPPDPSRLLCRNLCIAVDLLGSQHPTSDPDLTELGWFALIWPECPSAGQLCVSKLRFVFGFGQLRGKYPV